MSAEKKVKSALKMPSSIGANKETVGLGIFIVVVSVASSFIFNKFASNPLINKINMIRAGQN